ncbi:hypothetical protein, partial [Burkholderia cenocepacia]|uniref:hypothetical protein n=1 Tax=Burkholderia cenocepacia TaxID=95486 RepID=UPI001B9AE418
LFLVRFISAVLLSGSWSWKPDFLGFLGNRRLQPSTTPGTLPTPTLVARKGKKSAQFSSMKGVSVKK